MKKINPRKFDLVYFLIFGILLLFLIFLSINLGSIKVDLKQLIRGLFFEYDESVSIVYDLRFPRIIISVMAGAGIAVSGVLFQSVLKNPLADPGIIGINSSSSFFAVMIAAFFPKLYLMTPIFASIGGIIAFFIVYLLSWKFSFSPISIVLIGVAISTMFSGLSSAINFATGSSMNGVASIVNGNITMKTWDDVNILIPYIFIGIFLAIFCSKICNLMFLEDKVIRSLGINVSLNRIMISVIATILASSSTAIVGSIGFLGLIVPHISKIFIGEDHRKLIPFSMILGAITFLLADTLGRTIFYPYEIPASVIMGIVGGPFFIFILRKGINYE